MSSEKIAPQTSLYAGAEAHLVSFLFHPAQAPKTALPTSAAAARTLHPAGCFYLVQPSWAFHEIGPSLPSLSQPGEPGARSRDPAPSPYPFPLPTSLSSSLPFWFSKSEGAEAQTEKAESVSVSEVLPKRWRKEPKFCQERGVNERNLRKEPKLGISECERQKTFDKCQRPGQLGLPEVADCSQRDGEERGAPAEAAKDWDGLNCRKQPKLWRARGGWAQRKTRTYGNTRT